MTLEELFKKQSESKKTFTIEPTSSDNQVKITPRFENSSCGCDYSLIIDKKSITEILPTGEFHNCCGKSLEEVQIVFKSNSKMGIGEIFNQLIKNKNHGK